MLIFPCVNSDPRTGVSGHCHSLYMATTFISLSYDDILWFSDISFQLVFQLIANCKTDGLEADLIFQGWNKKGTNVSSEGYGTASVLPEQGIYLVAAVYRPVVQVFMCFNLFFQCSLYFKTCLRDSPMGVY